MNSTPFQLSDKNIVVTGASSGIGRQCAIACGEAGANVLLLGRNKERLEETLSLMQGYDRHTTRSVDINAVEELGGILKEWVGTKGKIDGLVHSAGISVTLPLRSMSMERIEETFRTNVYGAINLSRLVCKTSILSEKGASIIFITSVMASVGESGKSLYGMSKGALLAGSKSLAIEFAAKNIRFNCISPGVVITPMSMNAVYSKQESALEKIKSYHPMGLGKPEDVANGAVYLLSDASGWVTGTDLVIDGGYSAR